MSGQRQTQQDFLRHAMQTLEMTRPAFAERIGTPPRTLDHWLLPSDAKEFRAMPDMAWRSVWEMVENQPPKPVNKLIESRQVTETQSA